MIKEIWERFFKIYLYSLFATPVAFLLLLSGDQDYIVNRILTYYFLAVAISAFILWPIFTIVEKIKKKKTN